MDAPVEVENDADGLSFEAGGRVLDFTGQDIAGFGDLGGLRDVHAVMDAVVGYPKPFYGLPFRGQAPGLEIVKDLSSCLDLHQNEHAFEFGGTVGDWCA